MSNSRSWQRLCVLPGEMRASPRPGKAIGSFESRTKDFLPSGPREGEKRGVFVCMERVACSWEESCPGCLGGRMSASEGQAFILEKRALSSSSAAHGCASLPSPPLSCLSCQGAASPPGGPVPNPRAQCHCVPAGSKAPGTGG